MYSPRLWWPLVLNRILVSLAYIFKVGVYRSQGLHMCILIRHNIIVILMHCVFWYLSVGSVRSSHKEADFISCASISHGCPWPCHWIAPVHSFSLPLLIDTERHRPGTYNHCSFGDAKPQSSKDHIFAFVKLAHIFPLMLYITLSNRTLDFIEQFVNRPQGGNEETWLSLLFCWAVNVPGFVCIYTGCFRIVLLF